MHWLRRLARVLIRWATVVLMTGIALSIAFYGWVDPQPGQWMNNWLYLMHRSIRLLQAGLVFSLVVFLWVFRVPVSFLLRYLIVGWLLFHSLHFAIGALGAELGGSAIFVISLLQSFLYVGILAAWMWAIRRRAAGVPTVLPMVISSESYEQAVLTHLQGLNASLLKVLHG